MTSPAYSQRRCHNHRERQAACRCPGCGFDFCRECVTEHDERLLCSRCMLQSTAGHAHRRARGGVLPRIGIGLAGILAAWMFFFLVGEFATTMLAPKHEVQTWHAR